MSDREKVIGHLYDCLAASKPENLWVFVRKDIVGDALELLKEQPEQKFFVDSDGKMTPLPIREHGHWKGFTQSRYFGMDDYGEPIFRDGVFYVCSECRLRSIIKHPYCPRCGAKMDGEAKQDET